MIDPLACVFSDRCRTRDEQFSPSADIKGRRGFESPSSTRSGLAYFHPSIPAAPQASLSDAQR